MTGGETGQYMTCGTQATADERGTLAVQAGGDVCAERGDTAPHPPAAPGDSTGRAPGCPAGHPEHTECPAVLEGLRGPGGFGPQLSRDRREEAASAGVLARA